MFATEKMLANLFEFQRFCRNPDLQSVIDEVNGAYPEENLELIGDPLRWIAAAGEPMPDGGADEKDDWP